MEATAPEFDGAQDLHAADPSEKRWSCGVRETSDPLAQLTERPIALQRPGVIRLHHGGDRFLVRNCDWKGKASMQFYLL
jgi:hypothetical protein